MALPDCNEEVRRQVTAFAVTNAPLGVWRRRRWRLAAQPWCRLPPLPHADLQELQALYEWVDSVPLSRPKKNIARDFADGGEEAGRAGGGQPLEACLPLHLPVQSGWHPSLDVSS